MRDELILLARFGRPHGVRGEVRLQAFTADPLAIAHYNPLLTADRRRALNLSAVRPAGDMLIVRVEGITTREQAAALNGIELFVPRERLADPEDEDEVLLADLVGCEVRLADGTVMGTVIDVPNYGAGDLLDIRPRAGGSTVLLPFTKAFVPDMRLRERIVVIDPPAGLFDE